MINSLTSYIHFFSSSFLDPLKRKLVLNEFKRTNNLPNEDQIFDRKKGIDLATYPYWENGFMFVRASNPEIPSNGMTSANTDRKQTVCIAKRKMGDIFYAGAYPAPCLGE